MRLAVQQTRRTESAIELDEVTCLILLENYTINDPVLARSDVVDTNGSPNFNSGPHGVWVQNLAAPGHVSHRFTEAIVHRSVSFPKSDRTARRELSDCSRAFSGTGGRTCGLLRLFRHVLSLHKRLP